MTRLHFSIASLLGLVLFVAVAIAAMREATDVWDSSVFSLTLAVLLVSVLLAVNRNQRRRAYWVGFALFGSAYLGASLVPPIESRLLTTKGLAYVDSKMAGRDRLLYVRLVAALDNSITGNRTIQTHMLSSDGRSLASTNPATIKLWDAATGRLVAGSNGTSKNFLRIGHTLLALARAFAGGHISRILYAESPDRVQRSGPPLWLRQ